MSERGANSLHVYAWHGFVVKLFSLLGVFALAGKMPQPLGVGLWFLIALGLTVALSGPTTARFTQGRLLDPLARMLLRGTRSAPTT